MAKIVRTAEEIEQRIVDLKLFLKSRDPETSTHSEWLATQHEITGLLWVLGKKWDPGKA